jgi:uncharacterized protein (DUF2249 family)
MRSVMKEPHLDVRAMRKPEKHPRVFEWFDALAVGESFVLINNHDPKHLRDEFETDHPGSSTGSICSGDLSVGRSRSPGSPRQRCPTFCATPRRWRPDSSPQTPLVPFGSFN